MHLREDKLKSRYQDLSLSSAPRGFRGRSGIVVLLWQFIQPTFFGLSPQPAYRWRRAILKMFGAKVGIGVRIRPTARITYPWKVALGNYCWIGDNAELYSLDTITVGANSVISQRSYLCTGTHDYKDITFPLIMKPIVIESEAWIAADSFVAPGVTIGQGSIVAARSTVLHDVGRGLIVAGSPAITKKSRTERSD